MESKGMGKRIVIVIGFVALFSITGFVLYYIATPAPTCSDKKQNQAEKGIDCGGPCSPCKDITETKNIIIKEPTVVFGGNETFDAVAKITNPNDALGASSFEYEFVLKNSSDEVVASRKGMNFILPADSKYITELGFRIENGLFPTKAEIFITNPKWEKLGSVGKPQIGVYSKNFGKVSTGVGYQADGIIRNESSYDLNEIFISIILRNAEGKIIGVNQTKKNSVRTKEERDFKLTWPYELTSSVQNMEVDAQVNVLDSKSFSFTVQ